MTDPRVVRCFECCRYIPETEASFLGPDPYEWRCAVDREACEKLAVAQRAFARSISNAFAEDDPDHPHGQPDYDLARDIRRGK